MWVPLARAGSAGDHRWLRRHWPAFKADNRSEHPAARLNIVNWLNPIIWNPATREFKRLKVEARCRARQAGARDMRRRAGR
jgi:hypothetical protein